MYMNDKQSVIYQLCNFDLMKLPIAFIEKIIIYLLKKVEIMNFYIRKKLNVMTLKHE